MVKVLAATTGAIFGFISGIFLAAKVGLHEREYVFSAAAFCGAALGTIFMLGSKHLVARTTGFGSKVLLGSTAIFCALAVIIFIRMIS